MTLMFSFLNFQNYCFSAHYTLWLEVGESSIYIPKSMTECFIQCIEKCALCGKAERGKGISTNYLNIEIIGHKIPKYMSLISNEAKLLSITYYTYKIFSHVNMQHERRYCNVCLANCYCKVLSTSTGWIFQ